MAQGILFLEILFIFLFCLLYIFRFYKKKPLTHILIDCSLMALMFGTPILFTSLTRSVFEVTKLFLLRFSQWVILFILFLNYFLKFKEDLIPQIPKQRKDWQGIHWALILWVSVNILSFIFSPNHTIAWIGAYDRWEGIVTVMNYVILFYLIIRLVARQEQILWMIGALLFSGFLSSVYGIFQSTGRDFMNWSVDPTARVFASINNPVHYSAYMAMLIPPIICTLIYLIRKYEVNLSSLKEKYLSISSPVFWGVSVLTLSIFTFQYTANLISFGRGTWIGFSTASMLLFFFLFKLYHPQKIYSSTLSYMLGMFLSNALLVFKVHEFSGTALGLMIIFSIAFLTWEWLQHRDLKNLVSRIALLTYAGFLQFCTVHIFPVLICFVTIIILSVLHHKTVNFKINIAILLALMLILFIPSFRTIFVQIQLDLRLSNEIKKIEKQEKKTLDLTEKDSLRNRIVNEFKEEGRISKTEFNVLYKTGQYATHLKTGTARTSMWRSAIGLSWSAFKDPEFKMWIKEYPLLGTGPGTIKVFFPRYRRPEYGRLEGGHNFTPDKLHNEYVNTIATRGLLGFMVYYGLFIPLCGFLLLKRLKDYPQALSNYLAIGLACGAMVYLGQVMFNFGVVATKVLFYELLGLGVAILLNNPFQDTQTDRVETA